MKATISTCETSATLSRVRALDYLELTKPRIAVLVLVTVAVGAFVAAGGHPDLSTLAMAVIGTALLASGASALNQVLERDSDGNMDRTASRPLPIGRLQTVEAVTFGVALVVGGLLWLFALVNLLTAILGCVTVALYVGVYTPLKRRTTLCTLIGAIPGAMPPLMGWAAVEGRLDAEAWILFAIVFLWQFPHFLAIGWLYRADYARAGIRILATERGGDGMTARQSVSYTLGLILVSLVPTMVGMAGSLYGYGALLLGGAFLATCVVFSTQMTRAAARSCLFGSLLYLPLLLALLMVDLVRW